MTCTHIEQLLMRSRRRRKKMGPSVERAANKFFSAVRCSI